MFMKNSLYLIFALCLISCGNASEEAVAYATEASEQAVMHVDNLDAMLSKSSRNSNDALNTEATIERKLIKEGDFSIKTDDLEKTTKAIKTRVKQIGGYITKEEENSYSYAVHRFFLIRIPSPNFDAFTDTILSNATSVERKDILVKDVTEEFIDTESRLKNRKQLEQKYLDLLTRAKVVSEILETEKELNNVREEIESAEGRLKYLTSQVSFSTVRLNVEMSTSVALKQESQFVRGLLKGWNNFVNMLYGLITIWPFVLLIVGVLFLFRRLRKRRTIKKTNSKN